MNEVSGGEPGSADEEEVVKCVECGAPDDGYICLAYPNPREEGDEPVELCEACVDRFVFTDYPSYELIGARKIWLDSVPRRARSKRAAGGRGAAAAAEEETPQKCESCGKREPEVLTTTPTHRSPVGLPLPVWLCGLCVSLIPQPKAEKKKPKKRRGRVSAGRYGKAVMGLAYRFGGFSARQLGEMLLRQNPRRFEKSKATPERAAFASARDTLLLLRENRLMDSVGVWREHAVGERGGRIEEFYYLSPKGVHWGASQNDVVDSTEAKEAYSRHQLPKESEHAAYRNDIFLWMVRDFELERDVYGGDEEQIQRYASEVVVSTLTDFSGESDERYPYLVGRFQNRRISPGTALRGRTVERLFPDGRVRVLWADDFVGEFDFEAERESKAKLAARKVDRYAAYWLRLYKEMEAEAHAPRVRPLEEQAARIEEERARLMPLRMGEGIPKEIRTRAMTRLTGKNPNTDEQAEVELLAGEEPDITVEKLEEIRKEIEAIKKTPLPFMGLPDGVAPVVFVHQTKQRSENTRQKLRDREYPMPRFEEFLTYMTERMRGWSRDRLYAINQKRIADGEEPARIDFGAYAATFLDSLFIFTSWEELRQVDEDSDEEEERKLRERMERLRAEDFAGEEEELRQGAQRQLDEEDTPELLPGSTLRAIYTTLNAGAQAQDMTLRQVAVIRDELFPSEVAKVSPNT